MEPEEIKAWFQLLAPALTSGFGAYLALRLSVEGVKQRMNALSAELELVKAQMRTDVKELRDKLDNMRNLLGKYAMDTHRDQSELKAGLVRVATKLEAMNGDHNDPTY